jgi:hypothetical protein
MQDNTIQKDKDKHPCRKRDSNPLSQRSRPTTQNDSSFRLFISSISFSLSFYYVGNSFSSYPLFSHFLFVYFISSIPSLCIYFLYFIHFSIISFFCSFFSILFLSSVRPFYCSLFSFTCFFLPELIS